MKQSILCITAGAACALSSVVRAEQILAFPPLGTPVGQIQIMTMEPFGQTFTAIAPSASSISLQFTNMNMDYLLAQDHFVTLSFFAGDDFSSQELQSTTVDVDALLGQIRGTTGQVTFELGSVPTTVGGMYSFRLRANSSRYGVNWLSEGGYAGGSAIQLGNKTGADLQFTVVSNVPEPMQGTLMLTGLLPVFMWARNRARSGASYSR
jgi:hypothetical protein